MNTSTNKYEIFRAEVELSEDQISIVEEYRLNEGCRTFQCALENLIYDRISQLINQHENQGALP